MDKLELLYSLYNAPSADAVFRIVEKYGLNNPVNWKPYGDNQNNAGTFENQQASPENALVEKITNGIDSLLTLNCRLKRWDPEDSSNPQLPKTSQEAVSSFFNIPEGRWQNASEEQRREAASQLQIIVTEDKKLPNVAVYDAGEGQNPSSFPQTFLSLARGNKNKIPFVQGKYNVGATGAVVFCGSGSKHRYQMIISRRNAALDDADGRIGFTLVRRHILTEEEENTMKLSWYEYLVIDGEIPFVESDTLDLGLEGGSFQSGSVVKMYSYQLTNPSMATTDLWRNLNVLLYDPALPVMICENREYSQHSASKVMSGNKTRIKIHFEKEENKGKLFYKDIRLSLFKCQIPVAVYVFPRDCQSDEYIRHHSVSFLLNGQTQGAEGWTYITQKVGFKALKKQMMVCVDCSQISASHRQELFMASRDRMKAGDDYKLLSEELASLLRSDADLKAKDKEYKGQDFRSAGNDDEIVKTMFAGLKKNGNIQRLFTGTPGAFSVFEQKSERPAPADDGAVSEQPAVELKPYPTFLHVQGFESAEEECIKVVRQGGSGTVMLETDAENDFLGRTTDAGNIEAVTQDFGKGAHAGAGGHYPSSGNGEKIRVDTVGPYNGKIKLAIHASNDAVPGEIIPLSVKMISSQGEHEVFLKVQVAEPAPQEKEKKKRHREPHASLPPLIRVYENAAETGSATWQDVEGMTADTIVKLEIGDGDLVEKVYINMDSVQAKKYNNVRGADAETQSKKYVGLVYSHSLMIYMSLLGYYTKGTTDAELSEDAKVELIESLHTAVSEMFKCHIDFLMSNMSFD